MELFKKSFSFLDKKGHRANLEAEITNRNGYPEFTISGTCNGHGGQCLDEIEPRTDNQDDLLITWRNWHLKDISGDKYFADSLLSLIESIEKEEAELEASKPKLTGDDKMLDMMNEYGITDDNLDACKAYLDAFSVDDLEDFEESYNGKFDNDEEFARDMAENLGLINEKAQWPNNCIDWEQAASELMMDYTEQNGYYFRNL